MNFIPLKKPKVKKICAYCGKSFEVFPSVQYRRKNCSKECQRQWQRTAQAGDKNPNYRHGKAVRKHTVIPHIKRNPLTKICKGCEKRFITLDKRQKYCDRECYEKANRTVWIDNKCAVCEKPIRYPSYRPKIVCSNKCATTKWHIDKDHNIGTIDHICLNCKQKFTVKAWYKKAKYCSVECRDENRRIIKKCAWCGTNVIKPKSRGQYEYSFCSDDHRLNWLNGGIPSPSKPERLTIEILDDLGIEYEFQYPFGKYVFDFALLEQKIDLEIDGEYHHSLPHNAERDQRRDLWSRQNGWKVVRIPSQQVSKEAILKELHKIGYIYN